MKHRITGRICSISAAAVLLWTAVSGSGMLQATAHSAQQTAQPQYCDNAPVTVIVKVAGDAVLAQPDAAGMGADYLATDAAAMQAEHCKAVQLAVQEQIRQIYPALEVGYSYSTLYNGFSCELPPALLDTVRALPDVAGVSEAGLEPVPQMDRAAALSGFPVFCDMTGCAGEGQVIAVIDSELDTSHPMFAPLADGIETALSREDIAEIVSSGILNVDVDPDRAYLSSKLPYVVDYLDNDRYDGVPDPGSYHGTHVSGIAAGNAFTAPDGTELSGIAKDAQLMFFAIGKGRNINIGAAMAGFEDAVKLHADVITMSWGTNAEYYGDNPFSEAAAAADRAGIVICNSAGNADNGTVSGKRAGTPESPDTGRMADKAELGSPILFVASADNTGQAEEGMFLFDGQTVVYRPTVNSDGTVYYLSQMLEPGEYAYADCGTGTAEECRAAAPVQKLALVQRGSLAFSEIAANARENGAAGVIVIDREYPDGMQYAVSDDVLRLAVISYEDGQAMLAAEDKTVTVTGENIMREYPTAVSAFTSWGVKNSLDLRPDIMGIGGKVRSAAYGSTDQVLSGTSVAAPYVAGCAAVLREYLMQQENAPEGAELASYIRRLMMNSAIPYEEDGLYVTPRRQGAGLVSPARAAAAKVLMTGPAGDAKVNLFDELGENFSFDVEITNFSDEDVTFAEAGLRLTTDGVRYDKESGGNVLSGQQALQCSSDFSGPYTVGAGQSETVTVRVSLNCLQCSRLSEVFRYGFFIEGYLTLSGAENSADISIPVLGFFGDWTQLPVAAEDKVMAATVFRDSYYTDGVPLIEQKEILKEIRKRVPSSVAWYERVDLREYATEAEQHLLDCGRNEAWISPNDDGLADLMYGIRLVPYRNARADLELRKADGTAVYTEKNITFTDTVELNCDQSALPEGDYKLIVKMYIDYPGSAEEPQIFRSTLHVDQTAPEVTVGYEERNGRKILILTASDDRALQGAAISGKGAGGIASRYDPKQDWPNASEEYWFYGSSQYNGAYPWYAGDDSADTGELPLVLREWAGFAVRDDESRINFRDYVSFDETENGEYTLEYDVTELENYSVTVLDRAYNFKEIFETDDAAERFVQSQYSWIDISHAYYMIDADCITVTDFYDGSVTAYSYTARNNRLTLSSGGSTKTYTVKSESESSYYLIDAENDTITTLHYLPENDVFLHAAFHPVNEMTALMAADSAAACGREPLRTEVIYLYGLNTLGVRIYYEYEEDGIKIEACDIYDSFSLITGCGVATMVTRRGNISEDEPTRKVRLFSEPVENFSPGLYNSPECGCVFLFRDDGETGRILYGGDGYTLFGIRDDTEFTWSFDNSGCLEICYADYRFGGKLLTLSADGAVLLETESGSETGFCPLTEEFQSLTFEPISASPEQLAQLPSSEELLALCTAYERAATGIEPDYVHILFFDPIYGCNVEVISATDSYLIYADPLTMQGTDNFDHSIDLRNPPQLPAEAYSVEALRNMACRDFEQKTGTAADYAAARLCADGSVQIILWSDYEGYSDFYTIDPVSGEGEAENGAAVNLPQTGIRDPRERYLAVLAAVLLTLGIACCGFVLCRRKQTEV